MVGPTNAVDAVAFSPDGNTLAVGSGDGTVRLWNVTDPANAAPIGEPFTDTSPVFSVAFSRDGNILAATGSGNGTTQLWNLNVDQAINRICTTTSYNLTPQQWARYIPLPYDPPCRPR